MSPSFWNRSLTRRTLLQVAAVVGVMIVLATVGAYRATWRAVERHSLEMLSEYSTERAKREDMLFQTANRNLKLLEKAFLTRWRDADPADLQVRFDRLVARDPDGAWRSVREFVDVEREASTWIRAGSEITPELKRLVMISHELCERFYPAWASQFPSLYISSPLGFNSGLSPSEPDWVWRIPADFDQDAFWGGLGTVEQNPGREPKWTAVLPDASDPENGGAGFATLCAPVDIDGRHVVTLHTDIDLSGLRETVQSERPGVAHVVFRSDGRLIAHAEIPAEEIARGDYLAQTSPDPVLRGIYAQTRGRETPHPGYDAASGHYFAVSRLAGPDWLFVSMLSRAEVSRQALASAQWVLWTGLGALLITLAVLAGILRRQVSLPLAQLLAATRRMSAGEAGTRVEEGRPDELGRLAAAFNQMAGNVEERIAARTADIERALEKERELGQLKSNFVAMVSHEFRTPLEIILSSGDILERYLERLSPEQRAAHLASIQGAVKRMAGMMEEMLLLGRFEAGRLQCQPEDLHLASWCRRITAEMLSAAPGRRIGLELAELADPMVRADESLLRHILTNLLSNALKYSPDEAPVRFRVAREGDDAVFTVADSGLGIPAGDRERIFDGFHRGANVGQISGTGLGLVIARRCVELHGGALSFETAEGAGTTFTVRLPLFAPAYPLSRDASA